MELDSNDDESDLHMKFLKIGQALNLSGADLIEYVDKKVEQERERQERVERERVERERQERERQERVEREDKDRQKEIELEKIKSAERIETAKIHSEKRSNDSDFKMANFNEKVDEIDAYLNKFEQQASLHKWPKDIWTSKLQQKLTGKADTAFQSLSTEDSNNYDKVKDILLKTFQCTAEGFRKRIKTMKPEKGEYISTFGGRMRRYLIRALELSEVDRSSAEELFDYMLREHLYASFHPDLVGHLKELNPKNYTALIGIADNYAMAHENKPLARPEKEPYYSANVGFTNNEKPHNRSRSLGRESSHVRFRSRDSTSKERGINRRPLFCFNCNRNGHLAHNCPNRQQKSQAITCYSCGRKGHFAKNCRSFQSQLNPNSPTWYPPESFHQKHNKS
jgi:hypothetical protein